MLFRRRRPWYTPLFALVAVTYGLIQSEKLAPIISRWMDLDWFYEHGKALWNRFRN